MADIYFYVFLRTYLVADISFHGHIVWLTFLFVFFFSDMAYGPWQTCLYLAESTGPNRPNIKNDIESKS